MQCVSKVLPGRDPGPLLRTICAAILQLQVTAEVPRCARMSALNPPAPCALPPVPELRRQHHKHSTVCSAAWSSAATSAFSPSSQTLQGNAQQGPSCSRKGGSVHPGVSRREMRILSSLCCSALIEHKNITWQAIAH